MIQTEYLQMIGPASVLLAGLVIMYAAWFTGRRIEEWCRGAQGHAWIGTRFTAHPRITAVSIVTAYFLGGILAWFGSVGIKNWLGQSSSSIEELMLATLIVMVIFAVVAAITISNLRQCMKSGPRSGAEQR